MKRSLTSMLVVGMTLGSLVSCSKLDDTAKNAKMATENSGRAADAASDSREEIANGRMMTRSGSTSESRREALDGIMTNEALAMKITEASKYVKAFEFQLWTGQRYDTVEYLDQLHEDAMEEFFRSLYELNGDKSIAMSKLSPFKLMGKGKKHSLNIYAISLAMHGIHNVQEKVTLSRKNALTGTTSLYGLIQEGLRKAELVEAGKMSLGDLAEYEKTVYDYRDDARALIQVRYNAMLTLSIARLSNIKDSKVKGLMNIYLGLPRAFKSRFSQLNIGQQFQTNVYLDAAIKVKKYMLEIGMQPELIKPIKKLYGKMILEDVDTPSDDDIVIAAAVKKVEKEKFINNLSQMFVIDGNRLKLEENQEK